MKLKGVAAAERTTPLFETAVELYPKQLNPILERVGIKTMPEFIQRLEAHVKSYPEVVELMAMARRQGFQIMISGGTARVLIRELLLELKATADGAPARRPRQLASLLEGQDADALLFKPNGVDTVSRGECEQLMNAINRRTGAKLVDPLPSVSRRYYALEWDINPGDAFHELNVTFGGEALNNMGLGLDRFDQLVVYDPDRALKQFFAGEFDYVWGKGAREHDMVVQGKMDPALDGLRIIRLAASTHEIGIHPSEQAGQALMELGEEAMRRIFEVEANMLFSPDDKLRRRWAKYVDKIFIDAHNPDTAVRLLQASGYAELLAILGFQQHVLKAVREHRIEDVPGTPEAEAWIKQHGDALRAKIVDAPDKQGYFWTSRRMAHHLSRGGRMFGASGGMFGAGMYLSGRRLDEERTASQLLEATFASDRQFLNVGDPATKQLVEDYVARAQASFMPPAPVNGKRLGGAEEARSRALDHLCSTLHLDGVFYEQDGERRYVVNNQQAVKEWQHVHRFDDGLFERLSSGQMGAHTEPAVRALLAFRGERGLEELRGLIEGGKVTLDQLFPLYGGYSLFMDLPIVSAEFARFLEQRAAQQPGLSDMQRASIQQAVEYLAGNLPDELRNL